MARTASLVAALAAAPVAASAQSSSEPQTSPATTASSAPANQPGPAEMTQPSVAPSAAAPQSATDTTRSVPANSAPTASAGGAGAPNATLPHDLSPWAMFRNADVVVKTVMVGLVFASLITWTIFVAKRLQLAGARFRAVRAVRELLRAASLGDLDRARQTGPLKAGPVGALVHAASHERDRSTNLPVEGIKERAAIALGRIEARAARTVTHGTGLVASIGSTAPFVGLFGTVWGIMNSFVGISQAHTTNLAVVAPGIAEALLATAIGLVAAIPAVIIYNGLARAIAGYKAILSDASAEIMRHLSRDLDRQFGPAE